jgi:hypothetical protein
MKILYIAKHNAPDTDMQCDLLFLGLRSLLGPDVVDVQKAYRAYKSSFPSMFPMNELSFTLGGILDDISVDREDIPNKIRNRYFDLVFYGSAYRDRQFLPEVSLAYHPSQIVFIDGEDDTYIISELMGRGFYFKRELLFHTAGVFPIQFAIPKEKIVHTILHKRQLMAPSPATAMSPASTPGNDIRIYANEADYYRQYSESYFGITKKKGGWNTLRHLEIIAAGALPYFEGLEHCPDSIMVNLPKKELLEARELYDFWSDSKIPDWHGLFLKVRRILENHLTTEALARQVLDKIRSER